MQKLSANWRGINTKTRSHHDGPHESQSSNGYINLSDKGGSGSGLVLEGRGELLLLDVVTCETVDTGLDENHAADGLAFGVMRRKRA
jgi:hypothetical protein